MIPKIANLQFTNSNSFFLIAGPCVIENETLAIDIAGQIKELSEKYQIPFIFKGSYRKANRSRLDSFTGIGDEQALSILKKVKVKTCTNISFVHVRLYSCQTRVI